MIENSGNTERASFGFPEETVHVVHMDGRFERNPELLDVINKVDDKGIIASLPTICDLILVRGSLVMRMLY